MRDTSKIVCTPRSLLNCLVIVFLLFVGLGFRSSQTQSQGTERMFRLAEHITMDSADNIYFSANGSIFKLTSAGKLTRIAGVNQDDLPGDMRDGIPALKAELNGAWIAGLAVDSEGNVYVSCKTHCVRKISTDGIITTVAGKGAYGYSGDGGPATEAQLAHPCGLAVDSTGNLYIADLANHRVRKVTPDGKISTFAGNGSEQVSGDGGLAVNSGVPDPMGLKMDSRGNLYVAEYGTRCVRKISKDGVITTAIGDLTSQILARSGEESLGTDRDGNLYFRDRSKIRRLSTDGTNIVLADLTQMSGREQPVTLEHSGVVSLTVDSASNVVFLDGWVDKIRRLNRDGTVTDIANVKLEDLPR